MRAMSAAFHLTRALHQALRAANLNHVSDSATGGYRIRRPASQAGTVRTLFAGSQTGHVHNQAYSHDARITQPRRRKRKPRRDKD